MPKASKPGYEELKQQLDDVMSAMQQEDLDVDKALELYQKGLELIQDLEKYLKTAENRVTELKAKFNNANK